MGSYLLLKWDSINDSYICICNSFDYNNVFDEYKILKELNKNELYFITQIKLIERSN